MLNYDQRVACLRQAVKSLETADALQQRALGERSELAAVNSENIHAMINSLKADIESLDPEDDTRVPEGRPDTLSFIDEMHSTAPEVNVPLLVMTNRLLMDRNDFTGFPIIEKGGNI